VSRAASFQRGPVLTRTTVPAWFALVFSLTACAGADTLFHWRFDGPFGQTLAYETDIAGGVTVTRFEDSGLGGGSPYDVKYGVPNPWYNVSGTSADFLNDPLDNDPGVGLFAADQGVNSPLDLSALSEVTIEAFVCPYGLRQSVIIRKYSGSGYDGVYYIDTRPEGRFGVRLAGNGEDTGDGGAVCNDLTYEENEWYHVALVWNGSAIRFYVNGVQSQDLSGSSEVAFSGPIGDSDRALGIGCIVRDNLDPPGNSGQFFHGRIDEIRITDQVWYPSEFCCDTARAREPSPDNYAQDVHPDANLSWSPGDDATSHDVYFGTDFEDVNNGTGGTFIGNQEPNTYDPCGLLEFGVTYYWRIDEVDDTTVKGHVWRFTVADGKASDASPAQGDASVPCDANLSWTPGVLASHHDVYLGTNFDDVNDATDPNTFPGRGRQDVNSYNPPGDLTLNATYYWRVDEVGSAAPVRGDVWSFTVGETFTNSLAMEMVRIEPGSFLVGSQDGDFDEVPVHSVTISQPFYMSKYEVTNEQYEQFDPGHAFIDHRGFSHQPDEAVIFVSWEDANAFCDWLSQAEGLPYRLPTEAEWEYACRAGTTTKYYTGDTLPAEYENHQEETWGPHPVPLFVGQTPANPWGLYDVHGNVEEWCYDWYGPYEAGAQIDPVGRVDGDFRVSRGGSHSTTVNYLRSANRMGTLPQDKHWMIGFRPVIGELPLTEPLPEPGPQLYQIDVNQMVPPDINEGPDPNVPYFDGPRTYVKIPPESYGPLFSNHNHDPGFTLCPNGDLLAIWYTCMREPGRELAVAISRLRYGQDEWEPASPFWDAPDRNDHCPAMWTDESGKIYQFAGLADAATWGGLAIITRTSTDNGVTWAKARIIAPEHTYEHMPVESVFRASDGAILLPLDKNPGSHVLLSYDDGWTWSEPGGRIYGIHAGVVQLSDTRLLAFGRGDNINDRMPQSISSDMGLSWTYSASEFPPIGGGQRLILQRLRKGPILFISFTGSAGMVIDGQQVYGMFAALSYDECQTWPVKKLLTAGGPAQEWDGGGNTHWFVMDETHAEPKGYLACIQTPDGVIQLISSALHYRFNLAWLEYRDFLLVDDFEAYTEAGGSNPIYNTWQDSNSDPSNGAQIALETGIARGAKAMRIEYDGSSAYCRASKHSTGRDWTDKDSKALSLWFYGQAANDADDQMYVELKDTNGVGANVTYDGEANHVQQEDWHEWNIDLEDFNSAGLDLTDVNAIAIGINSSSYGTLYVDDIRLYPPRCLAEFGPVGDVTGDCIVDNDDLGEMAAGWLESEGMVSGVNPDPNGLLLWYKFDESSGYTVLDSSGRGYNGDLAGPESGWDPCQGYHGGCRFFSDDTVVTVPTPVLSEVNEGVTIALWLKDAYRADSDNVVFETGTGDFFLRADVADTSDNIYWRAGYGATDELLWYSSDYSDWMDAWSHYAFVKDAVQGVMRIYHNGSLVAEKDGASNTLAGVRNAPFDIGAVISHVNDFIGRMDDFKIYDYALSQAEIVGAATGGGNLFVPLPAPALDLYEDGKIDFRDYAKLAADWLDEKLWPAE
jgi:sulfatase modifying factor 1